MNQVLVLCGLTATGKTSLALKLARIHHGEIISVDARQAYRYMDIGTGKDLPPGSNYTLVESITNNHQEYQYGYYSVAHTKIWLYDIAAPDQPMHVGLLFQLTWKAIEDCWQRGIVPIVVGGDGFYLKSIFSPPETLLIPPKPQLRQFLETLSLPELQHQLRTISSSRWITMNHSDRHNPRRLIRAIEVVKASSPPITLPSASVHWYGLTADDDSLARRIELRVENRIKAGFDSEMKYLYEKYPHFSLLPGGQTLGYKQWPDANAWIKAEIAYAKRQKTWFHKQPHIKWLQSSGKSISQILF